MQLTNNIFIEPKILIIKNNLNIMCSECNHLIKSYGLDPFYPDVNDIRAKAVNSPQELYPNYCENCGVKLK